MGHKYFGNILHGKAAVITGANRGLGLLMARRFLECGAKVAICCAPQESYDEAVAKLKSLDPSYEVLGFKPNLSDEDQIQEMLNEIVGKWGKIDILVNNAGIYPARTIDQYPLDLFKAVFDVNVTGVFVASKIIGTFMQKHGGGCIVNTSSMAGIDGAMHNIGYTASKFAVEGLTLGLARELGKGNIRVNGVAPAGIIATDINGEPTDKANGAKIGGADEAAKSALKFAPLGSYRTHPDNIINAFIFLASDAAQFISGQTLVVSGACIWPAASPMSFLD